MNFGAFLGFSLSSCLDDWSSRNRHLVKSQDWSQVSLEVGPKFFRGSAVNGRMQELTEQIADQVIGGRRSAVYLTNRKKIMTAHYAFPLGETKCEIYFEVLTHGPTIIGC